MKVLLVGAGGQVGTELLRRRGTAESWTVTTRGGDCGEPGLRAIALDLADLVAVERLVHEVRPDVVLNAAAYTAVDRAENEPDAAFAVNAAAPGALAAACAATGARLVHVSTDSVFDGAGTAPYRETDPTSPLGVYGRSKLAGEQAIHAALPQALILRTAWVYALHGHNFLRTMLRLGAERDELRVVGDQIGCPTPAWLIAEVTLELARRTSPPAGILHLVAGGRTSWHGFADEIFRQAVETGRLARRPVVHPITSADYPTPAARPAFSVLATDALQAQGIELPQWDAALADTFAGT